MADNEKTALEELLKKLPPEDARGIVNQLVKITTDAMELSMSRLANSLVPKVVDTTLQRFGISSSVMRELGEIATETGEGFEDVLLKAMLLYKAAVEATHKGQRLVIVDNEYQLIREITDVTSPVNEPLASTGVGRS